MPYDQFFIDELRDRADLVRVIEPYAPLKKKGANWMACCPFHQEKTPSFSVNPAKGLYKCFGCGKGGNVFTFLIEMEGLSFPEAIERVAEISGVPLPEPVDDKQYVRNKKRKSEKKKLADQVIALNVKALEFWESELAKRNAKAKAAREYLDSRGISTETQKAFRIGYSPDSWDALLKKLRETGASDELIEQSGLVSVNEEKNRVFDRFRGRIMFPVLDAGGDPVAFGARAMGSDEPKYLNSPETPAYTKGEHLYGLFQARAEIRAKHFAILVEGYLDLIALYQFGVKNSVASLGTAFTPQQSRLLSRHTKRIVVNYDGDDAGLKAARRAIEILLPDDFEIKVLVLPKGQDPDDFVREHGAERYNLARGRALPYLDFVLDRSVKGRSLANSMQKAEAIEEVLPVLSLIKNPIHKRTGFDQAVNFLRIEDSGLKGELWNAVKNGGRMGADAVRRQVKRASRAKLTVAEQHLLELLVYDPELRAHILPMLEETDFERLATAAVFRAFFEFDSIKRPLTLDSLMEYVIDDEILSDFVPILMMTEPKREEGEAIDAVLHDAENCIFTLRSMAISDRILEVSQELIAAERSGRSDRVNELVQEHLDLSRMKQAMISKIVES